jgi:hypothetical protein
MTPARLDLLQTRRFVELAYPSSVTGALHVSSTGDWSGCQFARADLDRLCGYAAELDAEGVEGIYLRATTVRAGVTGRGKDVDSVELLCAYGDVDIAGPGHKHDPAEHDGRDLPPDEAAAEKIVTTSGLPASTLWMHSGGGLYPYWLLDSAFVITYDMRGAVADFLRRWQAVLGASARALGFHYGTGVGDLSRVLRLAGTVNRKPGTTPRTCRIDFDSGPRYRAADLWHALIAAESRWGLVNRPPRTATPGAPRAEPDDFFGSSFVSTPHGTGDTFADFETNIDWSSILENGGWEEDVQKRDRNGTRYWGRPGKDVKDGHSATTGHAEDRNRMWNFSDAAGLPAGESMTKHFVYTLLYHDGDWGASRKALYDAGYGARRETSMADNGQEAAANGARRITLTKASSITMRRVKWLWIDRIPLGEMSLLGGREGIGKSTVCYQLLADVTRGRMHGEHFGLGRPVIVAATEDSWEHTIIPRLTGAGADLDMVYRADVTTADDVLTGLVLPQDLAALRDTIDELGAAMVLLDPLLSRLDGGLDTHKDADVRRALEPLVQLAHDCRVAVLGLIHVNKSGSSDPLTSLMASRAFTAVVRSVLFCMVDPEDDSGERRILGYPKNNLGRDDQPPLVFTITTAVVGNDPEDGKPITCGRVVWQGEAQKGLRELIATSQQSSRIRTATDDAAEWLEGYLREAGGREASAKIKKDGKDDDGHTSATLKRAMKKLSIVVETESSKEHKRQTFWCLHVPGKPYLPGSSPRCSSRLKSEGDTNVEPTELTNSNGATEEFQSAQSAQVWETGKSEPTYSTTGEWEPPNPFD